MIFSLKPYVELDWLEKARKIFSGLYAFGKKWCVFWESVPKGRAEEKTTCFWVGSKKVQDNCSDWVFFFFFPLMDLKNPKPEGANCPSLGSRKPDLCNQPLVDRDLLWL